MKSSRIFKGGTILLVIALAVGVFALLAWADGNGTGGKFSGNMGNANNEIGRRAEAPDDDGDGIPNGQDEDYESICDEECDGTCGSEPKGSGMRRNASENENDGISEYLVHINGRDLKTMRISDVTQLWGIDAGFLLNELVKEFNLAQSYTTDNTIGDLRGEYRFSPYQIKEIAERIKTAPVE